MTRTAGAPGTAGGGFRDVPRVTEEDCTDTRLVAPGSETAQAIDLLELNPRRRALVRLTVAQWGHVDRVVRTLHAARQAGGAA